MTKLAGKVALVTGSSRGIGAAIARLFAEEGAAVAVRGRDEGAVASVRDDIAAAGGNAIAVTGELRDFQQIEAIRASVESELGPVDLLVANAGGNFTAPGPLEDVPEDGWRATIEGNLTVTFLTLKSFLPGMKERRRGDIITISSAAGRRPHERAPIPYGAAKAGIALITQDVALQAGPFGIRANCIAPETILTQDNLQRIPEAMRDRMAASHPIARLGTPEDAARAALFLASADSGWITGVVLDVSGGALMP
jgi:3-oxoacyl-[acyl-carrier protein] reductase